MASGDEKRSWREIDQMREKKRSSQKNSDTTESKKASSQAYKSYKSQLNKLFDGGGMPDLLREKLASVGIADTSSLKKAAKEAIIKASDEHTLSEAFMHYCDLYGTPEDEQVFSRLLDSSDAMLIKKCLSLLELLHTEGKALRSASLRARLQTITIVHDDPVIEQTAQKLLKLLWK